MWLTGFLRRAQVETLHRNALRVLEEVGARVEHPVLCERLGALGAQFDDQIGTVRFAPKTLERLIGEAPKTPLPEGPPAVGCAAGVYQSVWLDPDSGALLPFDETLLARYLAIARAAPGVEGAGLLGVPYVPEGVPPRLLPLAEKLVAWKWGASPGGGVHFTDLCAPLLDLFACHASWQGRSVEEVFAAGGYLISPLRLARPECEQLLWFHARGLRYFVGQLPMQGATAPVTLAGAVTLSLAEQMLLFLVRRSLWEDATWTVGGSVSTVDMRTGVSCYGRPEMQRVNAAFAELGRFYGCAASGHTGLTDARTPSFEAGAQKAAGALWTALACGHAEVQAGLLGMDEVCSPLQLVLDADLAEALRALLAEPAVDDASCALKEIAAVGPGGGFLGSPLTAERHRSELWRPVTWSREFRAGWEAAARPRDLSRARERLQAIEAACDPLPCIDPGEEAELNSIVAAAARTCRP
ncbi:MAG TPA: trimethylamine methyltransferase family protein [Chthonomonadales bacterium]|nr:trimethylamine methyltransferase family protein [Chthonomonadales bacterium]